MSRIETARRLRLLMVLRVVTVTTLLISAFAIELILKAGETLRPLFLLAASAYGLVLAYALLDRWMSETRPFVYLQLMGDAVLITLLVGITGGLDSPMSFLYLLPIIVAAMLEYRPGALALAATSWTLYAAVALGGPTWFPIEQLVTPTLNPSGGRVYYVLLVHLVAFPAVALLASSLAERVKVQGHELVERRGAVARLEALNENIIESIHSGLLTTDLNGRINFVNRGGVEITGKTPEELSGTPVETLFGLEADFLHDVRRRLVVQRRFRFERPYATPEGRRIFLGFAVSNLMDRSGSPLGYILIFQDLTEIRQLEQEVRLKERMAALGEMAAGMAHELRNPLAAISGAVQYLKGSLDARGETLDLMDIILKESHRLDQAIRDFLLFARPGTFNPQPTDLVRLIEENVKLLTKSREFAPTHRIATEFDGEEIWAEIDANRVKQVFWNLATNALKAMPGGGGLTIRAGRGSNADEVQIEFADDGVGMDEKTLEGFFQPFRSFFEEGTGLGAAIVYRLVEEHDGRITIDSRVGRGTRVRIVFPRRAMVMRNERQPLKVAARAGVAAS